MAEPAKPLTPFSGDGPMGLWDPSRATDGAGQFLTVGGSNPDEGHIPFDTHVGQDGPPTADTFFGLQTGDGRLA